MDAGWLYATPSRMPDILADSMQSQLLADPPWQHMLFPRVDVRTISPHARYVMYVTDRICHLIPTRTGEVRYRMLCLFDMYSSLLDSMFDLAQPRTQAIRIEQNRRLAEDCDAAWFESNSPTFDTIACEENLHPRPIGCILNNLRKMFHMYATMTPLEEKRNPLLALICKCIAQKHQLKHLVTKIRSIWAMKEQADVDGFKDSPAKNALKSLYEWWILFQLGAYRHATSPCLHLGKRLLLQRKWRQRNDEAHLRSHCEEMLTKPDLLLFAMKEYLVYAVHSLPMVYTWYCTHTHWRTFERYILHYIDEWRARPNHAKSYDNLRSLMRNMTTMRMFLRKPMVFFDYLQKQLKVKPFNAADVQAVQHAVAEKMKSCVKTGIPPTDEEMQRVEEEALDAAMDPIVRERLKDAPLALRALTENVTKSMHHMYYMRHAPLPPQLPDDRYIQHTYVCTFYMIKSWMQYMKCSTESVSSALRLIDIFFKAHDGRNTAMKCLKNMQQHDPYAYRILCAILEGRELFEKVQVHPVCEQLKLAHRRAWGFRAKGIEYIKWIHWMVFCWTCLEIKSLVVNPCDKKVLLKFGHSRGCAGFNRVVADESTGELYCCRKNGRLKNKCSRTKQDHIPLIGNVAVFGKHSITLCPQPKCAHVIALDSATDRYNQYGVMCAVCSQAERAERVSRKQKAEAEAKESRDAELLQQKQAVPVYLSKYDLAKLDYKLKDVKTERRREAIIAAAMEAKQRWRTLQALRAGEKQKKRNAKKMAKLSRERAQSATTVASMVRAPTSKSIQEEAKMDPSDRPPTVYQQMLTNCMKGIDEIVEQAASTLTTSPDAFDALSSEESQIISTRAMRIGQAMLKKKKTQKKRTSKATKKNAKRKVKRKTKKKLQKKKNAQLSAEDVVKDPKLLKRLAYGDEEDAFTTHDDE